MDYYANVYKEVREAGGEKSSQPWTLTFVHIFDPIEKSQNGKNNNSLCYACI